MGQLYVKGQPISIIRHNNEDYICLTDMLRSKNGDFFIADWLRNRNTLEFLSIWESMYNPGFNYGEFALIKNLSGLNSFKISVKEWTAKTNAIGVIAKAGRYGGTYAHRDIAFEFGSWISAEFKLYLIKEFQRLKDKESGTSQLQWNYGRFLSKINYKLHTEAIRNNILPVTKLNKEQEGIIYADEAELLNMAVFGITSNNWRSANKKAAADGMNVRDLANLHQLTVLSNLESYNAILIKQGKTPHERFSLLHSEAQQQFQALWQLHSIAPIDSPISEKYTDDEPPGLIIG